MKASIRMISEMTGYSTATVSNALNNKRGVSKETADKIIKVAQDIGYLSDIRISRVKLVTYIGVASAFYDSPFFSLLIAGVEAECRRMNMETVSYHILRTSPDYEESLEELLNDASSALIILATEMDEREAAKFQRAKAPLVILDNWYENLPFDAVLIDNVDSAYKAVCHMIEMGHTKIGHLQGDFPIKNFSYRLQGYLQAMHEHGLKVEPSYTVLLSPGMEDACADMARHLEKGPEMPTAFFADNDMIALGAMRALQQAGYSVPNDVSLVGFDDLPFCAISTPPLTTIKVRNFEMGRVAVRRLMELIYFESEFHTRTQVMSTFVKRESVRDLRGTALSP